MYNFLEYLYALSTKGFKTMSNKILLRQQITSYRTDTNRTLTHAIALAI